MSEELLGGHFGGKERDVFMLFLLELFLQKANLQQICQVWKIKTVTSLRRGDRKLFCLFVLECVRRRGAKDDLPNLLLLLFHCLLSSSSCFACNFGFKRRAEGIKGGGGFLFFFFPSRQHKGGRGTHWKSKRGSRFHQKDIPANAAKSFLFILLLLLLQIMAQNEMGWRDSWAWHMACKAYILTRVKMLLLGAYGIYEKYFSAYWFPPISTNSSLLFLYFLGGVQCTRFFLSLLISWSDLPIPPIPIRLPAPLSPHYLNPKIRRSTSQPLLSHKTQHAFWFG